jgi:hypothetical protein
MSLNGTGSVRGGMDSDDRISPTLSRSGTSFGIVSSVVGTGVSGVGRRSMDGIRTVDEAKDMLSSSDVSEGEKEDVSRCC